MTFDWTSSSGEGIKIGVLEHLCIWPCHKNIVTLWVQGLLTFLEEEVWK